MQIGKLYYYKKTPRSKAKLILVTAGVYEVDRRVSNFWSFVEVYEDGTIGEKSAGDYNNVIGKFVEVDSSKYSLHIEMSEELIEEMSPDNNLGESRY